MAKADVLVKFDAQTAEYVQKMLAIKAAHEGAANSTRNLGDASKKAGVGMEVLKAAAGSVVSQFGLVTTAAGAAAAGVTLVFKSAEDYLARMEKRVEHLRELSRTLGSAMANSGQVADIPQIRQQLQAMADKGVAGSPVSMERLTKYYAGISSQLGYKITAGEKVKATEAALYAKKTGMDDEHAITVGRNFGELSQERRAGGGLEGYTDEQLRDLAYKATIFKGELSDRDQRFISRSKDKNLAINLLAAAAQSDESTKGLMKMQSEAEAEYTPDELRKKKGPEGKRIRRLMAIPAGERYAAMLADPTLAPEADRGMVKNLAEGMSRVPATLSLQQRIADRKAAMAVDPDTRADALEGKTKTLQEKNLETPSARRDREFESQLQRRMVEMRQEYPDWVPDFFIKTVGQTGRMAYQTQKAFLGGPLHPGEPHDAEEAEVWRRNHQGGSKQAEILQSIHQTLREQVSVQRTRRDTVLSNDSEGQK